MFPSDSFQRVFALLHLALLEGQVLLHGGETLAGRQVSDVRKVSTDLLRHFLQQQPGDEKNR